ncbi:hypothetical protein GIB67_015208, partial [Kingdonia uniflora]
GRSNADLWSEYFGFGVSLELDEYHEGTNFGRTSGGTYITTSYDYDIPLDKFGNLNQPKWGYLKQLHLHLKSMEKSLTSEDILSTDFRNSVTVNTQTSVIVKKLNKAEEESLALNWVWRLENNKDTALKGWVLA